MADIADRAQVHEEQQRAIALAAHAARREPPRVDETGQALCVDCCEPIPTGRLRAAPHAIRCIICQQDHERRCR